MECRAVKIKVQNHHLSCSMSIAFWMRYLLIFENYHHVIPLNNSVSTHYQECYLLPKFIEKWFRSSITLYDIAKRFQHWITKEKYKNKFFKFWVSLSIFMIYPLRISAQMFIWKLTMRGNRLIIMIN